MTGMGDLDFLYFPSALAKNFHDGMIAAHCYNIVTEKCCSQDKTKSNPENKLLYLAWQLAVNSRSPFSGFLF